MFPDSSTASHDPVTKPDEDIKPITMRTGIYNQVVFDINCVTIVYMVYMCVYVCVCVHVCRVVLKVNQQLLVIIITNCRYRGKYRRTG